MSDIIQLKKVSVKQGQRLILEDINLNIKQGSLTYLIGRVGSGKSSLIKSLYAELPFSGGEAYVADYNMNTISRKQIPFLRRKIGIVFQDYQLLDDRNVYKNLHFVLEATGWKNKNEINKRIVQVLKMVELSDKINVMPFRLSGGEQQRVVIARALLNNPPLILADEPTGNLDPQSSDIVIKILHRLKKEGRAILLATHNYSIIRKYPGEILKCVNKKIKRIIIKNTTAG